ncbi:MAG: hypothetical protein GX609_08800 [Actinomycetales bacterium]|jgi:hypothetical protein|nr:hypothetical protein [Actinomycetales bacterium]
MVWAKGVLWTVVVLGFLAVILAAAGTAVVSALFVGGLLHAISTVG